MRVLITGCAGFIGSHLTDFCVAHGWNVVGVDNLSNGHKVFIKQHLTNPNKFRFLKRDFASKQVLDLVTSKSFDVVFHLAAIPRVSYSVEHPLETHDVNVTKTLQLIHTSVGNIKRFVFASSSSVYGGADTLPTPENDKIRPKSPYALQKAIIEDYLFQYGLHYGLESACMRFFNVFGPRALGNSPYSTAVAAWLTAIKSGLPLRSDGDGSQTRDICHVGNVVNALVLAANYENELKAEAFNVACGESISNNDILQYLLKRYQSDNPQVISAPWRAGDVMHTLADITKSKTMLGYQPIVKQWAGIEATANWYDKNWKHISKLTLSK